MQQANATSHKSDKSFENSEFVEENVYIGENVTFCIFFFKLSQNSPLS